MNKKGFTLIELLAVVVILLAITVISIASISAVVERNKAKQNETKKAVIISHAKLYYDEHKHIMRGEDKNSIYLSDLGLTEEEMKDANGSYFCGYVSVGGNGTTFTFVEDNTKCGTYEDVNDHIG